MLNYKKGDFFAPFKKALMRAIAEVEDLDNLAYLQAHPDKAWVSLVVGKNKRGKIFRERYELTFRRIT